MPDLSSLITPEDTPIIRPPHSSVSPQDIAAPHELMAKFLDQTGATLEAIAQETASRAGQAAGQNPVITRDENGNIQSIDTAKYPIIGPASATYRREANQALMNNMRPEIQNFLEQKRIESKGDYTVFGQHVQEYRKSLEKAAPNPVIGRALSQTANEIGGQHQRNMMAKDDVLNTENFHKGTLARITGIGQETSDIAYQQGLNYEQSDAWKQRDAERVQKYAELVADKRLKVPQELADQHLQEERAKDYAQAVVGEAARTYQSKGLANEARKFMIDKFYGEGTENKHLTVQQKERFIAEGIRHLENLSAEDKYESAKNHQNVVLLTNSWRDNPVKYSKQQYDEFYAASDKLGDWKSKRLLEATQNELGIMQRAGNIRDPGEREEFITNARKGLVPMAPERDDMLKRVLKEKGMENYYDDIKHFVHIESGDKPDSNRYETTQYKGWLQINQKQMDQYNPGGNIYNAEDNLRAALPKLKQEWGEFEKQQGRPTDAFDRYMIHNQGLAGYQRHLANPDGLAWKAMYEAEGKTHSDPVGWSKSAISGNLPSKYRGGVDSMTSQQFLDIRRRNYGFGGPGAGTGQAALPPSGEAPGGGSPSTARPDTFALTRDVIAGSPEFTHQFLMHQKQAEAIEAKYVEEGFAKLSHQIEHTSDPLNREDLQHFVESATVAGRSDLVDKLTEKENARQVAMGTIREGEQSDTSKEIMAHFERMKATGLAEPARKMVEQLERVNKERAEGYKESALMQGHKDGITPNPGHIDLRDSTAALDTMGQRSRSAEIIRQSTHRINNIPLIDKDEKQSFLDHVARDDPKQVARFFTELGNVTSKDNFWETMKSETGKASLDALLYSNNPDKVAAGSQVLDRLYHQNPSLFNHEFGEDKVKAVHYWQKFHSYYPTMEEYTKNFNQAMDPAESEARKAREEVAKTKELPKIKDQQIFSAMGQAGILGGWAPGFVDRMFNAGTTRPTDLPDQPAVGAQGDKWRQEFNDLYQDYRGRGHPPDDALAKVGERMATVWGVSNFNEGRGLMKNAPEKLPQFYRPVNGSYDWMRDQAEADVAMAINPTTGKPYGPRYKGKPPSPTLSPGEATLGEQATMGTTPGVGYGNWSLVAISADHQTEADITRYKSMNNPKDNPENKSPRYRLIIRNDDTGMLEMVGGDNGYVTFDYAKAAKDFLAGPAVEQRKKELERQERMQGMIEGVGKVAP